MKTTIENFPAEVYISAVTVPAHVLEESGLNTDCKLTCTADSENGVVHVAETDHHHNLTDLPKELLDTFRESGICLGDLEEKLMAEEVVYGKEHLPGAE